MATHSPAKSEWYYSIEMRPGEFTDGQGYPNVALTRQILDGIEMDGLDCLDIGAMDGALSVLMARRGANVTAYDREGRPSNIDRVKQAYDVDFKYCSGMSLAEFCNAAETAGDPKYDVVVFSGVLYHMFDPLGGLARARSQLRDGGILLLETSAVVSDELAMFFNADGRFYPGTNYFQPSVACLDYMLRFVRLQPLDCVYIEQHGDRVEGKQIIRICVPCQATDQALTHADDDWMAKQRPVDWEEFVRWDTVASDDAPISYQRGRRDVVWHDAFAAVDLDATVRKKAPATFHQDRVRLLLTDR